MSYFEKFGTVWYKFDNGSTYQINDLTKFSAFRKVWKDDSRTQLKYEIRDGELPHMISEKAYETVDYWWTVLLLNNIYDFENQWPRSSDQLEKYIEEKYPFNDSADIHHYVMPNGTVTDLMAVRLEKGLVSDSDAIAAADLYGVTIYDYENAMNELKRQIVLVDPDYIQFVASEFERLMNE